MTTMRIRKLQLTIAAITLIFILPACKPTEKNYKAAYDAAIAKLQKENSDPLLNAQGAIRDGAPLIRLVDGDTVWIRREHLLAEAPDTLPIEPFNVAVAAYKMAANAASQVEVLRQEGYKALCLRTPANSFYVIAGSLTTLREAATFIKEYKKRHPDIPFVGLPEGATIEVPLARFVNF